MPRAPRAEAYARAATKTVERFGMDTRLRACPPPGSSTWPTSPTNPTCCGGKIGGGGAFNEYYGCAGLVQLTHFANYQAVGDYLRINLVG